MGQSLLVEPERVADEAAELIPRDAARPVVVNIIEDLIPGEGHGYGYD